MLLLFAEKLYMYNGPMGYRSQSIWIQIFCSDPDPCKSFGSCSKICRIRNPDFTSMDALLYGL
jgi:hypothetical protein